MLEQKGLNRKPLVVLVCCLLLTGACSSCQEHQPTSPRKSKVALVFCDVTNSLIPAESEEVAILAAQILDSLPAGTKYVVYPINIETQRLSAIAEGQIITEKDEQAAIAVRAVRRQELTQSVSNLYKAMSTVKDQYGKPDNRTCILNTLVFAEDYFRQFNDPARYDLELIFISDMLEECNRTPLHTRIELAKRNLSKEIALARDAQLNLNLSHVRITAIIPTTQETYKASPGRRPSVEDVKEFWKNIFRKCGFTDESLRDDQRFYFAPGLPERFKTAIK
jgi:hypothetical protein